MRQFLYTILLAALFGFNAHKIEAKETIQHDCIACSAAENQDISGPSDFLNHAASKEDWHYSFQRLFPTLYKFSINTDLFNTKNRLLNSVSINSCVVKSENQIIRFEGVEIIHPFNYFW